MSQSIDELVWTAVFGETAEARGVARWEVRSRAAAAGIRPASIHDLYMAMGRGDAKGFTVPAINVRAMAYDTARAVVRAAKKYNSPEKDKELDGLRALIKEEIAAGFYNIDIDTSTLVDLSKATLPEQQKVNCDLCADFTQFIRSHEPKGVTIS